MFHNQISIWSNRRFLFLIALCLLPIVALAVTRIFQVPVNGVLLFALILLCPISHFLMMGHMMGHGQHNHSHQEHGHATAPGAGQVQASTPTRTDT